jgi:hypothetical protein
MVGGASSGTGPNSAGPSSCHSLHNHTRESPQNSVNLEHNLPRASLK